MIRRIFLVLALAAAGCGGSSPGGGGGAGGTGGGGTGGSGGGGSGSVADLAMPADMSMGSGFCGGATCTGGTTCCVVAGQPSCMSSCPDGGLSAQCQKPTDCTGGTGPQACCITIANYMPSSVMCTAASSCVPMISALGQGQDRACVTATDCTGNGGGTSLPDCCTSVQSGQHVCFSKTLLTMYPQQLGSLFTCP